MHLKYLLFALFMATALCLSADNCLVHFPRVIHAYQNETVDITVLDDNGLVVPAATLQWKNGAGNGNPLRFKVTKDLILHFTYSGGGCLVADSIFIYVKPRQLYYGGVDDGYARAGVNFNVAIAVPPVFCVNENLVFKATAKSEAGSASFRYRWWKVGHSGDILVSEQPEFFLQPSKATDAGFYYCDVRDENGYTVRSDTQQLNLMPLTVHLLPRRLFVLEGEQVQFTAVDTDSILLSKDSLLWYSGKNALSGKVNPLSVRAGSADAQISVLFTNNKGCIARDSVFLWTKPLRRYAGGVDDGYGRAGGGFTVKILKPLTHVKEYCEGNSVDFQATVPEGSDTSYSFRWWKVGKPTDILIADRSAFTLANPGFSDGGYYFCEARDINGFFACSDTVRLSSHQVHLPAVIYAMEQDRIVLTAKDGGGNPVESGVARWYGRWTDSDSESTISPGGNPLNLSAWDRDFMIRVHCNFPGGCVGEDSTRVFVRSQSLFMGGDDDGYDRTSTPPVITKPRLPRMLCTVDDSVRLQIAAIGSDLLYQWEISLDAAGAASMSWAAVETLGFKGDESSLLLNKLPADFTASFRCMVYNRLGSIYSDTLLLYGHHLLQVKVDPAELMLYNNRPGNVNVSLEKGVKPWTYYYTTPSNVNYRLTDLKTLNSNLPVREPGMYRITYLRDSLGCEVHDSLPLIHVTSPEIPVITISGDREICAGEEIRLKLEVVNGVGPWQVYLAANGLLTDSVTMSGRDTTVVLPAYNDAVYTVLHIYDRNKGQQLVEGETRGRATILVNEPDLLRFAVLNDNHIGICRPVSLFDKLRPSVEGIAQSLIDGSFYLNGRNIGGIWNVGDFIPGAYTLEYRQSTAVHTCSGRADISLALDNLPSAELSLPGMLCADIDGELKLVTTGNEVSFKLGRTRFTRGVISGTTTSSRIGISDLSDNTYRENVRFLSQDSCLAYQVSDITDRHNCTVNDVLRDTVYNTLIPEILISTRYPDEDAQFWETHAAGDTLFTWGEEVGVMFTLLKGNAPFQVRCIRLSNTDNIYPVEEIDSCTQKMVLKDEGTYLFGVQDKYCSSDHGGTLIISQRKPGYLRLKVFLEGLADKSVNASGQEKEIRVELCRDGKILMADTCFVSSSGDVRGKDGNTVLRMEEGEYDIVIRSDGYLPVRSKKSYHLNGDFLHTPLIDFTDEATIYCTTGDLSRHMTLLGVRDGKKIWALSTVEANYNQLISIRDRNNLNTGNSRRAGKQNIEMTLGNRDKYSEVR